MSDDRGYMPGSTFRRPKKGLERVNHERRKRLRAKQFGTDGKREWIVGMLCGVSGRAGTPEWPIDPCHVGSPDPDERGQSSRASGADDTYLFPMIRPIHTDFDSLPEAKFEELYGVSKQWVREYAENLHQEWVRLASEQDGDE